MGVSRAPPPPYPPHTDPPPATRPPARDRKTVDVGANLFIGNLDPDVDEKMLYDTFSAFGITHPSSPLLQSAVGPPPPPPPPPPHWRPPRAPGERTRGLHPSGARMIVTECPGGVGSSGRAVRRKDAPVWLVVVVKVVPDVQLLWGVGGSSPPPFRWGCVGAAIVSAPKIMREDSTGEARGFGFLCSPAPTGPHFLGPQGHGARAPEGPGWRSPGGGCSSPVCRRSPVAAGGVALSPWKPRGTRGEAPDPPTDPWRGGAAWWASGAGTPPPPLPQGPRGWGPELRLLRGGRRGDRGDAQPVPHEPPPRAPPPPPSPLPPPPWRRGGGGGTALSPPVSPLTTTAPVWKLGGHIFILTLTHLTCLASAVLVARRLLIVRAGLAPRTWSSASSAPSAERMERTGRPPPRSAAPPPPGAW